VNLGGGLPPSFGLRNGDCDNTRATGQQCQTLVGSARLVAVFAADVEGYGRLMGVDEVGTLKGLTQWRAMLDKLIAVQRPHREHGGRLCPC
jgi:class 3 adenylate cyclase